MMDRKKKNASFDQDRLKKGQLLIVKIPPFFEKEYFYEIVAAGEKLIRADLFHSPRVKKQWTPEELDILFENKMIRFAEEPDLEKLRANDARRN